MKDILLITNYWHFQEEKESSRFHTLADMIVKEGMKLEIVTSTFYHPLKKQRQDLSKLGISLPYEVTFIREPGYQKNVSFRRLWSQFVFGIGVKRYLKMRKMPDIIYCVVPTIEAAYRGIKFGKRNGVRTVIDIQDLWPEAFQMVFSVPILSRLLFYPIKRKVDIVYANADEIIAVSQSYTNRALQCNKKNAKGSCVYLGLSLAKFDEYAVIAGEFIKPEQEIWITYIGTLGISYDLCTVMDALVLVQEKTTQNIRFYIVGDGPRRAEFEAYAKSKAISCTFTGFLPYPKVIEILKKSDMAVNPITKRSAASIINKHGDYLAAGLPIVSTQQSEEWIDILESNHIGFTCRQNDITDLAEKILLLAENDILRKEMGDNSRRLAESKFDRSVIYGEIIQILKEQKES